MTEEEFLALGRAGYNRIPLQLETLADLDTPLSIYLKLANRPGSYLLESVIGGERFGRYSIVGLPARERLEVTGSKVSITRDGGSYQQKVVDDPLEFIDGYLKSFRAAPPAGALRFGGGLPGYFGYDTVRHIERRLGQPSKPDPLGLPDTLLLLIQPLDLHVLFRLRRLPAGGRLARDPGAPRGRQGDVAAHRRHSQARLHA